MSKKDQQLDYEGNLLPFTLSDLIRDISHKVTNLGTMNEGVSIALAYLPYTGHALVFCRVATYVIGTMPMHPPYGRISCLLGPALRWPLFCYLALGQHGLALAFPA